MSSLAECLWQPQEDGSVKCSVCGIERPFARRRRCGEPDPKEIERLLGDRTKALLAKHGITEEWYKSVKEKLGFAPTCDCPERVEYLNNADKLVRGWKQMGIDWLRKHIF